LILLDDLLLAPGKSIMWIFRSVHRAATEELEHEGTNIRAELSDLYRQLERGEITEAQFDARERTLLDRLDDLEAQGP